MGTVGHPSTGLVGSFCVDNEEGNGPKHGFQHSGVVFRTVPGLPQLISVLPFTGHGESYHLSVI